MSDGRPTETERQSAILGAALDCVVSMDQRGCVTYFNAAAERTFGYRADEVLGRELAEVIVPPALRDAHRRGLARHLATGERRLLDRRIELTAMRADGSEFPAELTVTRVDVSSGEPAFTGYVRDITERKRAEQNLLSARTRLAAVADEQAALRRVATLVAEGAPPRDVFDAVCEETGRLMDATAVNLAHFTPDGFNLTMAGWSLDQNHVPTGTRLPLDGETIDLIIHRTRAPARVPTYEGVEGELAQLLRELGIEAEVGAPVIVEGRVWGALIAGSDSPELLPDGAETRVASFAELVGISVSNAIARSELVAARRRVIEAGDAARRRLTRDLHDGAQQDLVNLLLNLQLAQDKWADDPLTVRELLDHAATEAQASLDELRDLAAGIHPEILTDWGLAAAAEGLAERLPLPVKTQGLPEQRLPQEIEASIYFFVSEALTNVVKHAKASSARVEASLEDERLTVEVSDDGVGGAQAIAAGSGLVGLGDRIAALDGTLTITSEPGQGTTLHAVVPLGSRFQPAEASDDPPK